MTESAGHLLFWIDDRPFSLALTDLAGAADCGELRRVPGAPDSVLGLTAWRGRLLTVVDVGALLCGSPTPGGCWALLALAPPLDAFALAIPTPLCLDPCTKEPSAEVVRVRPAALLRTLERRPSETVHG